jgi:hypothetical protein
MEGGENMTHVKFEEVKKNFPSVQTIHDYAESLRQEEPTVIFRDYDEPKKPPYMEEGVKIFDFEKNRRPKEDVELAYGTRANIPGMDVLTSIREALGPGGYCIHIADGSYTDYSIWELNEFMRNFDNTNLRTCVHELFDCDDFSQVLQGNVNGFFPGIPLGTIWYGPRNPPYNWGHSVNIFYNHRDRKTYLIEPQTNAFYEFDKKNWMTWMVIL